MIKELFRGIKDNRYTREPLEYGFALEWQRLNDTSQAGLAHSTFDYLMDTTGKYPPLPHPQLSDRDWKIANTVVQWLGSHVGTGFIAKVYSNHATIDQIVYFVNRIVEGRSNYTKRRLVSMIKKSMVE